jgi:hypothetical protein
LILDRSGDHGFHDLEAPAISRGFRLCGHRIARKPQLRVLGGDFVAIRLAEWTGDIALVFSGLAGLLHWDWWFPALVGTIAALTREASQGFLLTQQCGSGYLIRSITMTCLLCAVVATAAYMLSVI